VSIEDLFRTILDDMIKAATMPVAQWVALSDLPIAPLAIPVSSDRNYPPLR